jgi:[ribosomal protein S5]-alanine N-acetyltransferase
MKPIIETARLSIRKFAEEDAAFIFTLLNSKGWLEFIGDRNIKTIEDARLYILNGPLFSYLKFGFGSYLIALKDTNLPIGMSSLIKRDTLEDVDLGFALLSEYSGKGYAFEASEAVMRFSKEQFQIQKLLAITNLTNTRSVSLLKKLGFKSDGTITFPNGNEELSLFSKT